MAKKTIDPKKQREKLQEEIEERSEEVLSDIEGLLDEVHWFAEAAGEVEKTMTRLRDAQTQLLDLDKQEHEQKLGGVPSRRKPARGRRAADGEKEAE